MIRLCPSGAPSIDRVETDLETRRVEREFDAIICGTGFAVGDYLARFDIVPGDDKEFIPLPE